MVTDGRLCDFEDFKLLKVISFVFVGFETSFGQQVVLANCSSARASQSEGAENTVSSA